jgi:HD superfamily phosphohydrolase
VKLVEAPKEGDSGSSSSNFHLGFGEGGWGVAEQMIAARYLMYTGLYFHKTKRIYEIHLTQFMPAVLAEWKGRLPAEIAKYLSLSDSTVWAEIVRASADNGHSMHLLANRFLTRNHLRRSIELVLADNYVEATPKAGISPRRVPDKNRFDRLVESVRIKYGIGIVSDSPDHSSTKMFDAHNLLVVLDGKTRYLDDVSEIVSGMSSRIWRGRIYADGEKRSEVHDFCRKWLDENPVASQVVKNEP